MRYFGTLIEIGRAETILSIMFGLKLPLQSKTKRYHKYYKCDRCGYISIVKNSNCPICTKDGKVIKMK